MGERFVGELFEDVVDFLEGQSLAVMDNRQEHRILIRVREAESRNLDQGVSQYEREPHGHGDGNNDTFVEFLRLPVLVSHKDAVREAVGVFRAVRDVLYQIVSNFHQVLHRFREFHPLQL